MHKQMAAEPREHELFSAYKQFAIEINQYFNLKVDNNLYFVGIN